MDTQEENLPELFRIDFYDQYFFIGELIRVDDEDILFSGFIQFFDNHVICTAPSKRRLLDTAEEMCYLVLSYAIHLGHERTIEIMKTRLHLN